MARNILCGVLAAALVSGCATLSLDDFADLLRPLKGQPADAGFAALGYPTSQMKVGDDTVYTWMVDRRGSMVMPQTTTTTGQVGGTTYSGQTTGLAVIPTHAACEVQMGVGTDGLIKRFNWRGNTAGCGPIIRSLQGKQL